MASPTPAPDGKLRSFAAGSFGHQGVEHGLYRKGDAGPAVIVLTEIPGITPQVLGFADRLVAIGCRVVLPDLFGRAGKDPKDAGYMLRSVASVCVSREFTLFAIGRTSPIVAWLRALAEHEHQRCGGPGVGVIGMCFTGGFALAMAVDARVLVPVLSQPGLPVGINAARRHAIDCADADLDAIAARCANDGLRVLGLRFKGDPMVPRQRFEFLRERLGDGFIAVEIAQAHGHPDSGMRRHHSVLTTSLIDEPGQPTRAALDQVLALFREKLLGT